MSQRFFGGGSFLPGAVSRWVGIVAVSIFCLVGASGGVEAEPDFEAEIAVSEERVANYERDLSRSLAEAGEVGVELGETRVELDSVNERVLELDGRLAALEQELEFRERERRRAEVEYRAALVSAYRGGAVSELGFVLEDVFAGGDRIPVSDMGRMLLGDAADIEELREAEEEVLQIISQVGQTKQRQEEAAGEQATKRSELSRSLSRMAEAQKGLRREIESEQEFVVGVRAERRAYLRDRMEALRRAERARIDARAAATAEVAEKDEERGQASEEREPELRVAEEIYAEETEELPYDECLRLYRESAERYGFGDDWYVLAAIGKIESDHGQNLGPSSAGAMGPMQFLPSTWETSGVDGNGDGFANIMDPEDAIPAAAGYLVAGGAPGDWYAAIYSYNHADWYVQEVMTVADGYRNLDEQGGFD